MREHSDKCKWGVDTKDHLKQHQDSHGLSSMLVEHQVLLTHRHCAPDGQAVPETCQQNHCEELQGQSQPHCWKGLGRSWRWRTDHHLLSSSLAPPALLLSLHSHFPWSRGGGQWEEEVTGVCAASPAQQLGWQQGLQQQQGAMRSWAACTSISAALRSWCREGNIGYRFGRGWIYNWEDESSLQILALECLSWQEAWWSVKIITEWPKSKQTPTFSIYYQDEMTCLVELKYL